MEQNIKLRKKIEILKPIIQKFTFSSEKASINAENQKSILIMLKLVLTLQKKNVKYMFTIIDHKNHSVVCFKCNKVGHRILDCNINKSGHILMKQIWILKRTMCSNLQGSKVTQVPKFRK